MYQLPDLPYAYDALEPVVSATTMRTHHDKHHRKYVDTLNELAGDSAKPLEDVVREAAAAKQAKLFNNAGQAWNHAFFWQSMAPGGAKPDAALTAAIQAFGGEEALKKAFVDEGVNHFASGWVWIVAEGGALEVVSTHDADTALLKDATPILVCDLWEHAYYLDYKQDRPGFLDKWWTGAANWAFASAQFAAAQGEGQGFRYPAPVAKAA